MIACRSLTLAAVLAALAQAQLTPDQRVEDFKRLAGLFAYNYAPYEWKREQFGVDLYDVQPWLERVRRAPSDLEAIEVMSEYVASLRDTHAQFQMNANFTASQPLSADLLDDGRVVIDGLNRAQLPVDQFPIQVGDEVISVDGRSAEEWIRHHARFLGQANERARRRLAAAYILFRTQSLFPRAFEIGENAVVVIRHAATDALGTYEIPWTKRGTPIRQPGPVISPLLDSAESAAAAAAGSSNPAPDFLARYHDRAAPLENVRLTGYGSRQPYFALPAGFQQRLGREAADFHFSGIYMSGGKRIGYLRIRNFSPPSFSAALNELTGEIPYFQQNTDGLVVDVSRNPGGGCFGAEVLRWLIPYRFELPSDEVRATLLTLVSAQSALLFARARGAEAWQISLLEQITSTIETAYKENRGRTGPLPFCNDTPWLDPMSDRAGRVLAYSKPLLLIADEFTTSWGDTFATAIQDNRRGPVFGYRTNGAGGAVSGDFAGFYSETFSSYSITLGTRNRLISTPEHGTSNILENAGVRPDIPFDYMTAPNVRDRGQLFTAAFTEAIVAEIDKAQR